MIDEAFSVEQEQLVRRVVPRHGTPYEHRCTSETFQEVAHRIDELGGTAFVLTDLNPRNPRNSRTGETLAWTQVAVALAFLKERGCVRPVHGRKHEAASSDVFLDAMTEFHALRESPLVD